MLKAIGEIEKVLKKYYQKTSFPTVYGDEMILNNIAVESLPSLDQIDFFTAVRRIAETSSQISRSQDQAKPEMKNEV